MRGSYLLGLLFLFAVVSAAGAQEWPRFRGPNGSGVSATVLPTRWTDKDYRWQIKLPGPGHSSPVVWGERLFVTSAAAPAKLHVLCLDTATGRTLWSKEYDVGAARGHQDNNLASSTPAVDAQRLYLSWGTAKQVVLLALTHEGQEAWRRDLGPYRGGHGYAASPIVHEGLVILHCEQDGKDSLAAVDAATGQDRWRTPRKSRNSYATPCLLQLPDKAAELIAVSYEDGVTSLDPATGKLSWALDVFDKRHAEAAITSPFVHRGLILATAGWLGVRYETIAVKPGSANTASAAVYKLDRGAPLVPTPVASGELLFLCSDRGLVSCHHALTGARWWSERVEGGFYASPVVAGQHVYCPTREGDMIVWPADRQFTALARVPLGEGTHATPAIAGGRMFVRTLTRLMCLQGVGKSN